MQRPAGDDVGDGPLGDGDAPVDDDEVVGEPLGLLEGVGGHHDAGPLGPDLVEQPPDLQPAVRVQSGGRLVEEEHIGTTEQGGSEPDPLALPAGEPTDRRPREAGDVEPGHELGDVERVGIQPGEVGEQDRGAGAIGQPTALQHDADPGAVLRPGPPRLGAEHGDRTAVRALQPDRAVDRGGLAGPIGPEDRGHRVERRRPGHPGAGGDGSEPPFEPVQVHGVVHAGKSSNAPWTAFPIRARIT